MLKFITTRSRCLALVLASSLAVTAIAAALIYWRKQSASQEQSVAPRAALAVAVAPLLHEQWPETVVAAGTIVPWQEMSVTPEVDGLRVAEIHAEVGDHVKAGQLLARLSDVGVRADVEQARAALDEARAQALDARQTLTRVAGMSEHGALSDQQVEQYRLAVSVANAREAAAQAGLRRQQRRLDATRVVAPDHGIVSARGAVLGASGGELFRLIRQGRLEWQADIAQEELPRVAPGMSAQVGAASRKAQTQLETSHYSGRVRALGALLDQGTRNAVAYVELKSPGTLRAGMYVRGTINTGESRAAALPQQAVVMREGFPVVFSVSAGAQAVMHKVTLGRRQGELVEIVAGLPSHAGEMRFVTQGAGFVGDGDTVRIVGPTMVREGA